jgi:hypothetical protein
VHLCQWDDTQSKPPGGVTVIHSRIRCSPHNGGSPRRGAVYDQRRFAVVIPYLCSCLTFRRGCCSCHAGLNACQMKPRSLGYELSGDDDLFHL